MIKLIKILGIGLISLAVVVAVYLYHPLAENPDAEKLAADAAKYNVEIIRDNWGVPHILGDRDQDVSFGLAYAHAEDDFETIQETLAATRGVLASYRGRAAATTDYIVSLMDIWGTIDSRYESDVPNDVKEMASAYVAGLNLYAAHNPDKTWQGLAPFKAEDVIAGFLFKTPFFYGLDTVLLDLLDENRQSEIALAPDAEGVSWQIRRKTGAELGSNAIAVNAKRSGDATTRLLINSHQPMTGPVAWYEAHLISKEGLDISGGLFPGTPVILHGYNRDLAWANTVNHIDLADTYALTINPQNDLQYLLDGKWRDFQRREITISVKLFGPFRYLAKRQVLRSEHGPVLETANGLFAVRYAGMGEIRQLEQYYRLNQSTDLPSFLSAMSLNALPSINYVYADKDDNIAFIHNAQYPNRNDAWDWSNDLPGDRSDLIWQAYHPFSAVPKLINPSSGVLFNANNTPYNATDGDDNLSQDDFPQSMGLSDEQTNRSLRLIELTEKYQTLGRQELFMIKFDTVYSKKSEHYQTIEKIMQLDVGDDVRLKSAIQHLKAWNRDTSKENTHAALAVLTLRNILRSDSPNDRSNKRLREALHSSIDYLLAKHGSYDIPWGDVNRLIRGDVNLPLDGGPDILRAIYSFGLDKGEPAYATHGDTWMALVEWGSNGEIEVDTVHQFGSASKDRSSKHFSDQANLFATKKWRKALINIEDIRANAQRSYNPRQAY